MKTLFKFVDTLSLFKYETGERLYIKIPTFYDNGYARRFHAVSLDGDYAEVLPEAVVINYGPVQSNLKEGLK